MNIPMKLTILRILLLPVFILTISIANFWTNLIALVIFLISALTDTLDGWIARKSGKVTSIGALLDPIADKLITSAAFISFVGISELGIPPWMPILIIFREFLVTALRNIALLKGKVISAYKPGKYKMTLQSITIILILLILLILRRTPEYAEILRYAPYWLMLATTLFTTYSGFFYLYKNKNLIPTLLFQK